MKFCLLKNDLEHALKKVISVCETGANALPHFFHFKFDGLKSGHIKITASNAVRRVELLLTSDNQAEFCFGLSGHPLYSLMKDLPDGELLFEFDEQSQSCKLSIENSNFVFKTLPPDRFPDDKDLDVSEWVTTDLKGLFGAISKISYCSDKKENSRAWAKAVVVTEDHLMCTDGYRMSVVPNSYIPCKDPIMIPVDSATHFGEVFKDVEGDGFVYIEDTAIHFSMHNTYVMSRLLSGRPPRFENVIPSGPCLTCNVKKGDIYKAVKRATVVCSMGLKPIHVASVILNNNFFEVRVDNEGNWCTDAVPCQYEGERFKTTLNLNFLLNTIRAIEKDSIVLEFRGEGLAILITDKERNHKNVILPIRTS